MSETNHQTQHVIVTTTKSIGISLILTFLFGPLGMLYSTAMGGIIMIILSVVLALLTAGLSIIPTWIISMIWGAVSASSYNKRMLAAVAQSA